MSIFFLTFCINVHLLKDFLQSILKIEITNIMLNKNEPIEKIIEFTELTEEEIENIEKL